MVGDRDKKRTESFKGGRILKFILGCVTTSEEKRILKKTKEIGRVSEK